MPAAYPAVDDLREHGWMPIPRKPLPCPGILAASTNAPVGNFDRVAQMARDWGGRLVDLGAVGHLNPAADYGEWPRAEELLCELC